MSSVTTITDNIAHNPLLFGGRTTNTSKKG